MLRPRLIPTLLVDRELHLVKTTQFSNQHYLGDPFNAAYVYSGYEVDELIVLDIEATPSNRLIDLHFVESLATFAKVPLTVGGGIKTLDDIERLIALGVERVVLGAVLRDNFNFLTQAAQRFGSSTLSVIINVSRDSTGKAVGQFGRHSTDSAPAVVELALACEKAGAGEVVVYDTNRDGMREGFDIPMYVKLNETLSVPLVAVGGAGCDQHITELAHATPISGIGVGSHFVYAPGSQEVLLNYPKHTAAIRGEIAKRWGTA